jgi:acetylornithine deacetylase/succinyl-diaminopimelate desuccinylase-like protein
VLLETCEESGSPDLPGYLEQLRDRLGEVSLVICLDSGAQDYDRMWLTTSLRGMLQVEVTARVLESGQHSGIASGVVPSSFQVLRVLLDRLQDATTGRVLLPELQMEIPADRFTEAKQAVAVTPGALRTAFPLADGVHALSEDDLELTLNSTWRPTLSVTGANGLPAPGEAGNVLRPQTTLCLSFRLPPTADSAAAAESVRRELTTDAPFGAQISIGRTEAADGWNAPAVAPWLRTALDTASTEVFGAPWRSMGMGGSIPFMGLLHEAYPRAQFVVTGALGPDSNAHVPDESLNLEYATKLTAGVALILNAHASALGDHAG